MGLNYQDLKVAADAVIKAGNVPNIVGDAGIGKSALVADLAVQNGAQLFTTVVSLSEKGDLAIPVPPLTADSFVETKDYGRLADVQFGYSHTLIEIIEFAERHPHQPIYWFLDEFNRGSQAVQSELMNLVLQRTINSLRLPAAVHIIIAENPDATMSGFTDREYHVANGDAAINDRTVRLVLNSDVTTWLKWAAGRVDPAICAYLEQHPEMLNEQLPGDDIGPTPRAWARLSTNYQQLLKLDASVRERIQADVFAGDIGSQAAASLTAFLKQRDAELAAQSLLTLPLDQAQAQFQQLAQAEQVRQLEMLGEQELTIHAAELLVALVPLLNPDGQYAWALNYSDPAERLERLYQAAQDGPEQFQQLYQLIERIGLSAL